VIGLGFAGVGWLGESLLRDLPGFPELRLMGVQDARGDLAAQIAKRYASPWHGDSFDKLLGLPGLEAVVICTPNGLHAVQTQVALQAGKHVLVQKPLALSEADAVATVELGRARQRLLFVDYTYRFLQTMDAFRAQLGQVLSLRATFHNIYGPGAEKTWFFDSRLSGGGALTDLGVHLLDLGLWLVQPTDVTLVDCQLSEPGIEHAAALRLRLDDIPFDVAVSWHAAMAESQIAIEAADGRGTARWENVDGSFFHFRARRDQEVLADCETTLRVDTLRAFCAALKSGRAPPIDTRVYGLLDQAYGRTASSTPR